jgi:hypothetical protein
LITLPNTFAAYHYQTSEINDISLSKLQAYVTPLKYNTCTPFGLKRIDKEGHSINQSFVPA